LPHAVFFHFCHSCGGIVIPAEAGIHLFLLRSLRFLLFNFFSCLLNSSFLFHSIFLQFDVERWALNVGRSTLSAFNILLFFALKGQNRLTQGIALGY
jgi:hypothetical protein